MRLELVVHSYNEVSGSQGVGGTSLRKDTAIASKERASGLRLGRTWGNGWVGVQLPTKGRAYLKSVERLGTTLRGLRRTDQREHTEEPVSNILTTLKPS
jgi:hypothetical protein